MASVKTTFLWFKSLQSRTWQPVQYSASPTTTENICNTLHIFQNESPKAAYVSTADRETVNNRTWQWNCAFLRRLWFCQAGNVSSKLLKRLPSARGWRKRPNAFQISGWCLLLSACHFLITTVPASWADSPRACAECLCTQREFFKINKDLET